MNGSAPTPAGKLERGTTAAEICVFIPHEAGVQLLVRTLAAPPADPGEPRPAAAATPVVWRRRAGNPVVHAYAANACVDVPLCGSCFKSLGGSTELPPPPAHLGPYRRCRKCMKADARGA
jgi:hypothetical protein